jgi:hypothetical protein
MIEFGKLFAGRALRGRGRFNAEERMKRLKILPGAAGVIALTAMIGFVDGKREAEAESFSRGRVTLVEQSANPQPDGALSRQPGHASDNPVYLVEINHGNRQVAIKVDAVTGRVVSS